MKVRLNFVGHQWDVNGEQQYRIEIKRWWGWKSFEIIYARSVDKAEEVARRHLSQTTTNKPGVKRIFTL
jgi:hypothetical protein